MNVTNQIKPGKRLPRKVQTVSAKTHELTQALLQGEIKDLHTKMALLYRQKRGHKR